MLLEFPLIPIAIGAGVVIAVLFGLYWWVSRDDFRDE